MTIINFNPNNLEPINQPSKYPQKQYLPDYPEDSFEFVDYDLDEVEQPRKKTKVKSLEVKNKKERDELLKQAWHIYYNSVEELNEKDTKAYYQRGYSTKKDNHFEISKYSKKGIFGSYKIKEVFVFKNNAPVSYSKYKLGYSYSGRDGEGFMFSLNEKLMQTCDFLR